MKLAARRTGFTLIELLIVIVVIAILALIVIPRVMGAGRKAKEAALKSDLQQIRNAIERFQSDCGAYPAGLEDLVATGADIPEGAAAGIDGEGGTVDIPTGSYKGPYLSKQGGINNTGIPLNPFVVGRDDVVANHWTYPTAAGAAEVHPTVPADGDTLDGIPYQSL